MGREDLVEAAQMGTSELVSNAVLHGRPPYSIAIGGTATHPRIEVRDGSTQPPTPPRAPAADADDVLSTFGRGLAMVALSSIAWGATVETDGKVVWFEPATGVGEGDGPEMVLDQRPPERGRSPSEDAVPVALLGIDVETGIGLLQQQADLRRELRLLAVAHTDKYPLAANLSAMFDSYERNVPRQVVEGTLSAHRAGLRQVDVHASVEPGASEILTTMLEMFDLADAFCKAERLLSLQRTPDQRALHVWCLSEIIRQAAGQEPTRYRGSRTGHKPQRHARQVS